MYVIEANLLLRLITVGCYTQYVPASAWALADMNEHGGHSLRNITSVVRLDEVTIFQQTKGVLLLLLLLLVPNEAT